MYSEGVAHRLRQEFGFLWVKGEYTGSFDEEYLQKARKRWHLPTEVFEVPHDFSYAPEFGVFIDLTVSQFDKSLPTILLLENTDPRIALSWDQRDCNTTHYVRGIYDLKNHGSTPLDLHANGKLVPRRYL